MRALCAAAGLALRAAPPAAPGRACALVRAGQMAELAACLAGLTNADAAGLVNVSCAEALSASRAALLLPGTAVVRVDDRPHLALVLRVLSDPAVARGAFDVPPVTRVYGCMAAWRYATPERRVLVCANESSEAAVAYVTCADAPDAPQLEVRELMSGAVYTRNPAEMRGQGLHVILNGHQLQVFAY
jgi:hypothetical protein